MTEQPAVIHSDHEVTVTNDEINAWREAFEYLDIIASPAQVTKDGYLELAQVAPEHIEKFQRVLHTAKIYDHQFRKRSGFDIYIEDGYVNEFKSLRYKIVG